MRHTISLGVDDLAATRFAVSPLAETVFALQLLRTGDAGPVNQRWLRWARHDLARRPLSLPLLWPLLRGVLHSRPEFLTPAPAGRTPSFDQEAERMRATPPGYVRASLERVFGHRGSDAWPDSARELAARPGQRLELIAGELTAAHARLIVPHWVAQMARRLAEQLTRGTSPRDAVAAARDLSAAAEAALQAAVDRARAAGQSWREIGDVVGTSRQAAFQRFGHPVDPRTGTPMTRAVPPRTVQRAEEFVARFTACRWEEVLGDLDDAVRERLDVNRLAAGWAQMIGMFGNYQGSGEVSPVSAGDNTVVDVRLNFEAGEAMLLVQWNSDGKITGLRLHRPST